MQLALIHSFRRGTGKSTIAANVGALLAMQGYKVCLLDINFPAPALHVFFGVTDAEINYSINDYLWGDCTMDQTVIDLTRRLRVTADVPGQLSLVPASFKYREITRMMQGGYYIDLLGNSFDELAELLSPDILLVDTPAGLNEETLFTVARADMLAVLLRPDNQDYLGTSVILEVAERLEIPETCLVINEVPSLLDTVSLQEEMEKTFHYRVAVVLPHSTDMMTLASRGLFVLHHPQHPITIALKQLASQLVSA